jgi:sterol-4alpha-carboxylate 3-dehydrogenase (decarboxylating)
MDNTQPFLGTVLVTGGCGFLGSHIVEAFLNESSCSKVMVVTRNPQHHHHYPNVDYLAADITDYNAMQQILNTTKPNVIIHNVISPSTNNLTSAKRITVDGTKQLLELAISLPFVKAFIYTSSQLAVEPRPSTQNELTAKLNTLASGFSPYARTKGAAETIVLKASCGSLRTCVLRITSLYGERDKDTINNILKTGRSGATNVQIGDNSAFFDWVYSENAALAYTLAAKVLMKETDESDGVLVEKKVSGEAFFITDDSPMRMWDFSRKVWQAAGIPFPPPERTVVVPMWVASAVAHVLEWGFWLCGSKKRPPIKVNDVRFIRGGFRFSIDKARERLGYQPLCDTEEGIRRSVEWLMKQEEGGHDANVGVTLEVDD